VTASGPTSSGSESLLERLRRATIGRYDVYAELGAGGMATVYLALDLALERKVAIKVLNPALAGTGDHTERFKREAKVAASLNHPNIIGIHAVGDDPELAYFVMKYVEGRALDSVVRDKGAQSVPFVRSVIASAASALQYAHARGVIHRDVKPANFMLDKDGWLIVTDFGIAKVEDAKGLTMTGSVLGTPYYMSPEQFQGRPVTASADQYALGVVAFELLTGRQPYAGDTVAEVMKGHLFDPIPSARSLNSAIPESVDAAIARMLAKEPADRFVTLDDAVAAFGSISSTQEVEVHTQIIRLAESGARGQPQLSVPLSPSPEPRARAPESQVDRTISVTSENATTLRPQRQRATWLVAAVALLIGGAAATAALRPDLVNRLRKSVAGGRGDLADTAQMVSSSSVAQMPEMPTASTDPAKRELEIRDSIEQIVAEEMRDSIAYADSLRRAGRQLDGAALARRRRRQQAIRDSLATRVVPPPPPIPGSMVYGTLRIGSRCPSATLVIGTERRAIGQRGLLDIPQLGGEVKLEVRTLAGARWDTTFAVSAGSVHEIGYRPIRCQ